jgi:2,3-bisphosphoglycerate-independent phosphoglycerate mutase
MRRTPQQRIMVILDGAAEPIWPWPSTLEEAHTPAIDALCAAGAVARIVTTPPGLTPGSETGIPTLLGVRPAAPVARGLVEAAAAGIDVPVGQSAWRIDLHHPDGARTLAAEARLMQPQVRAQLPDHDVRHLKGHRLLAVGARRPGIERVASLRTDVWPDGRGLPRALDGRTVVISAQGAAAGCGRMLGARVVTPSGATGDVGSDLWAKTRAALAALEDADTVVVHIGGADEAAHFRDRVGKKGMIESADHDVIAPLARAVADRGGLLAVTCDHATCVETGRHSPDPVPLVVAGAGVTPSGPQRLHEREVAAAPVVESPWDVFGLCHS